MAYSTNDWPNGFTASLKVTSSTALSSWSLQFSFPGDQQVTNGWSGEYAQSGHAVTITNAPWNGTIAAGGSVDIGFNGGFTAGNPRPTSFTLNGTACTVS